MDKLFKDSLQDFRVEPPKEEKKRLFNKMLFLNAVWGFKKYFRISILVGSAVLMAGGAWIVLNKKHESDQISTIEKSTNHNNNLNSKIKTSYHTTNADKTLEESTKKLSDSKNQNQIVDKKEQLSNTAEKNYLDTKISNNVSGGNSEKTKPVANKIQQTWSKQRINQDENLRINNSKENKLTTQENFEESKTISSQKITFQLGFQQTILFPKAMVLNTSIADLQKAIVSKENLNESIVKKKINIGIGASFGYFSKLKSIDNLQSQNLFLGGLDLNFELSNWMLNSGINYQSQTLQLESKFLTDSAYTGYESIWVTDIDTLYLDSSIQIVDNSGYVSTPVQKTDSIYKTSKQNSSLKYLEIPLLLGRNFNFNKHNIGVFAGLGFNFLNQQKSDYTPTATFPSELIYQAKSFYVNYNIRFQYAYSINKHWRIIANAQFKQNGKNAFTPSNLVDSYLGFNLGTAWWF